MKNSMQLIIALTTLLNAHSFRFSGPMKALWQETGSTKHVEATKKLRIGISPSDGNFKVLIDSNTKVVEGISDFEGNKLDSEEVFTITGIRVSYDTHADAGKEGALGYRKAMSSTVRNSALKLKQGEVDLFDKELSVLNNNHTVTNIADEIIPLQIPVVLVGGKSFEFSIQYPEGGSPASTKEYLEVMLVGFVTKRSSTRA